MKKFIALMSVILIIFTLFATGLGADAKGKKDRLKKDKQKSEKIQQKEPEETPAVPVPFEGILSQSSYKISSIDTVLKRLSIWKAFQGLTSHDYHFPGCGLTEKFHIIRNAYQ